MGYTGGTLKDPTYHNLGDHSESIQIDYDPTKLTFDQILDRIWTSHNPCATAWSRQYMSAIFYEGDAQRKAILESKARMEEKLGRAVKTAILPLGTFWLAEDYHQKYELRCTADLIKEYKALFPSEKDLLHSTAAARVNGYIAGQGTRQQLQSEIDLLGLSDEGKKRLQAYVTR